MAKYAAKGEPRSQSVQSLFKSCVNSSSSNSSSHTVLRRCMLRTVGERDFSAQETAHMVLSLPLVSCSFNFITISLSGSKKINRDKDTGELVLQRSFLEDYAEREVKFSNTNLQDFAANYSISNGKVVKRSKPVVVRTFPYYSCNPQGEQYPQYCHYQLIKYHSWTSYTSHTWQQESATDEEYVSAYRNFLQTDYAQQHIPSHIEDLERAQQYYTGEYDDEEHPPRNSEQEEWMQLCQLNQQFADIQNSSTSSQMTYADWAQFTRSLPPHTLMEAATWIRTHRENHLPLQQSHQACTVDVSTLNSEQRLAYEIVSDHHQTLISQNQEPPPLRMIVCGTAGTGKSYLINAISQCIMGKCILSATTGMAAFNIYGQTLHSVLQLPVRASSHKDLQGPALHRLQKRFQNISYLIVDEMSMLGQTMFAWVDKRLRQATGKLDQPLGGISLILFGDFAQLPPVGDVPLYTSSSHKPLAIHGYTIYRTFETVVMLNQVLRQSDNDPLTSSFRELLMRLRDGEVTLEDWQTLLHRSPDKASNCQEFVNAVHLFYDRKSVAEYNYEKVCTLGKPIATIKAIHSDQVAACAKPDDAGGLHPLIFLAEGARVMLTANLWQQTGLCNGSAGTVYKILYQEGHEPPSLPIAVLVQFDQYTGPTFINNVLNCVPITPKTFEWEKHSRQQLPLQLRYAITIHKSQGQTIPRAVINIGKSELSAGCTFVAVSRLKRLEHGLFHPMTFERLQNISKSKRLAERKSEDQRLCQLHGVTAMSH